MRIADWIAVVVLALAFAGGLAYRISRERNGRYSECVDNWKERIP